jgi:hypothetical protein
LQKCLQMYVETILYCLQMQSGLKLRTFGSTIRYTLYTCILVQYNATSNYEVEHMV